MRYVLISDDATVSTIDDALAVLRTKRKGTGLALIRRWIDLDIDELLDMRLTADLEAMI